MRTLVTGATGFIGTHLVEALLARGDSVSCLVRPTSKRATLSALDPGPGRLSFAEGDVLDPRHPKADVIAALNFSYNVFKSRGPLRDYFRAVRKAMAPGGIFFLDSFGGTGAMEEDEEDRKIPSSTAFDGTKVPKFTYVWEQAEFNPVNHGIRCHIHFKLGDGTRIRRAFTYDWRLWTLPELQELMLEAGFAETEVYVEGWDDEEDDTDGIFRRRKRFENMCGWVTYVVGLT